MQSWIFTKYFSPLSIFKVSAWLSNQTLCKIGLKWVIKQQLSWNGVSEKKEAGV
jgi:hypothetical protein